MGHKTEPAIQRKRENAREASRLSLSRVHLFAFSSWQNRTGFKSRQIRMAALHGLGWVVADGQDKRIAGEWGPPLQESCIAMKRDRNFHQCVWDIIYCHVWGPLAWTDFSHESYTDGVKLTRLYYSMYSSMQILPDENACIYFWFCTCLGVFCVDDPLRHIASVVKAASCFS